MSQQQHKGRRKYPVRCWVPPDVRVCLEEAADRHHGGDMTAAVVAGLRRYFNALGIRSAPGAVPQWEPDPAEPS